MNRTTRFLAKIVLILAVIIAGCVLFSGNNAALFALDAIPASFLIDYPTTLNYRQTINDCGPFNTAAVVRALKENEIDSQVFAENIKWRLPNKYTLPWGLKKQLKENGIFIETPNVKSLSDKDKIAFLRSRLSQKNRLLF